MKKPSPLRKVSAALKREKFRRSGMKPWTKGYIEYKNHEIQEVLRQSAFPSGRLPTGYGFRLDERIVEYPWLFSRLPRGRGTLLDAGSVLNFDFLLEQPALAHKEIHICTLAPEADCFWEKGVSYLFGDLRRLPYRDGWFDWIVCVSTLEHVGLDNTFLYTTDKTKNEMRPDDYLIAVAELRRILKPGGTLYATVPYGRKAMHGFVRIFGAEEIEALRGAFSPSTCEEEYFLYHRDGWQRSNGTEAAKATFFNIHETKEYDPDYAASARAICCLEMKKPNVPQ